MRRSTVLTLTLLLVLPEPARAEDEEIGFFFAAMGLAMLTPLGAGVLAAPVYLAAELGETQVAPRPTAGNLGMDATVPGDSSGAALLSVDVGGYVGKAAWGWEARGAMMAFGGGPQAEWIEVRWDGLLLYRFSPATAGYSAEALVGGTVWPSMGIGTDLTWSGGPAAGLRLGTWFGGDRLVRLEGEGLWRGVGSELWPSMAQQLEARASATLHVRFRPLLEPSKVREIGLGLTVLGMFPDRLDRLTPRGHVFLFTASF